MKKTEKFTFLVLAALGMADVAFSQQPVLINPGDVKIKKIEFVGQPTPIFVVEGVKMKDVPRQREWMEVEVEFKVEKGRNDKEAVVPELTFRYYVGFQDQTGKYVLLTGDVTHLNVQVGEDHFSAVYIAPTTHGKLTGDYRRLDLLKVKGVGVEVFYNGVKVGMDATVKTTPPFWESPTMSRQPGTGILPKDKTPFAILWIDRYPEIKSGGSNF